jgi:hypothetical protein
VDLRASLDAVESSPGRLVRSLVTILTELSRLHNVNDGDSINNNNNNNAVISVLFKTETHLLR